MNLKPLNLLIIGTLGVACVTHAAPQMPSTIVEKFQFSHQKIVEADAEKRRILSSLYVINQRMKKITNAKSHLTDEMFQVQDNVQGLAKVIASLEVEIAHQRQQIKRRLRALYKISGEGYIETLFSQTSFQELDETMRFLKIVTDSDYKLLKTYQTNVVFYREQKDKLKVQITKLVNLQKQIRHQEGLLAAEHVTKTKIVSELDHQQTANLQQIRSLRSHVVDSEMADLLKPSIYEKRGSLPAPIDGTVKRDFGFITDEKYKIRLAHKGWRYQADPGTHVDAVFEGKVSFVDRLPGYGNTIIVDHGDHYYTLYADVSRVRVKLGDAVRQGQVIAAAGPATSANPPGLYFEVRHFSEPENPASWIESDKAKTNLHAVDPAALPAKVGLEAFSSPDIDLDKAETKAQIQ